MKNLVIIIVSVFVLFNACQQTDSETMKVSVISEGWTYQQVDGQYAGKATVPGTIHTDLLNNGQIEDPFYRTNEKDLQWIDKEDWVYQTSFVIDSETMQRDRLVLHFNGLDTYADVYLNDSLVLEAFNMHREWSVNIKPYAREGKNQLKVYLHSPIKKGLELYEASPYAYPASNDQSENGGLGEKKVSVFTRKAGYHYGWDWGPRFVTSGIWRTVELRSWDDLSIESVYIKQPLVTAEKALLEAEVKVDAEHDYTAKIIVNNGMDGTVLADQSVDLKKGFNTISLPFEILKPKLWWSNGLGDPNLYTFDVKVLINGKPISHKSVTTGLRSVKLIREKDNDGESFLFELIGVRVFAKGANYIPNDSFLPRVTKADYDKVVADAVNANMNMLRIWGGGIYEDNYFYELCDKNGIMVWQDFMFACSMYPGDEAFLNNVEAEAVDNVVRLRNHPSIVLWCGNNEINTAWHYYGNGGWGWKQRYSQEQQDEIQKAYIDVFHRILPDVVGQMTGGMDYWPSSPQAGYEPDQHASYETKSGDMHYWGVWHGLHPFEDFDKYKSRFMSEYGFQSFPDLESVKTYALPEDYNIESEVMAAHQRSGIGNLRIKEYLSWYYEVPEDFEQFLYMSQVLQAHGIRMAIEAHRRAMPYCMGSLYWQINDCWPVASWSSTDYYHKWKAVHYSVKKAFEPVMISTVNKGKEVEVFVVSDLLTDQEAELKVQVMDFEGHILHEDSNDIKINKNSSTKLNSFKLSGIQNLNTSRSLLLLSIIRKDEVVATKIHYFDIPKNIELPSVEVNLKVEETAEGYVLRIKSDALARNIYIYDDRSGLVLEDNYFDLLPDQEKRVRITSYDMVPEVSHLRYKHLGEM